VIDCASVDDWPACQRLFSPGAEGTVLLERLLDLPPSLQARLVGLLDSEDPPSQPRILATVSVDTEAELRGRALRQDLLDRLAVHVIRVPPLRERADEIADIALEIARELRGVGYMSQLISSEAHAALRAYRWPGNVRELRNVLRRAISLRPHGQIDIEALPPNLALAVAEPRFGLIEQLEGEAILRTLHSTGGNVSKAAHVMGLSRATVYRRLHAYRAQGRPVS
jgi:transcriptional regulator of acetoin/glycerol metabolism